MRSWHEDSLLVGGGGGRCERWKMPLLGDAAYITNADAAYRKLTSSPKGWWLRCVSVFGHQNLPLEATTTEEAKREASERIAQALERMARELRRGVAPEVLEAG